MSTKAFLIAVSDYTGSGLCNLRCQNDLPAVTQALIKGLAVNPWDIIALGESGRVLSSEILDLLNQIKCCDTQDVLIFYFSGHGSSGKIHFSDRCLDLYVLIDFFKLLPQRKVLIFDSCYSGQAEINHESDLEKEIERFDDKCAVLASCRCNETSGFHLEKDISLYTSFLCDAITYSPLIRNGKKSLDEIASFISFLAKSWGKKNGLEQHPVYRSSLTGSLFFQVKEYYPFVVENYYFECDDFIICNVEPLHHAGIKRYAVKCIIRGEKKEEDISRITHLVASIVKPLKIFSSESSKKRHASDNNDAKIIWCYWGYDEQDICYCTWAFRSTWVDADQDKAHWYKECNNAKVIGDVLVINEAQYSFIRTMMHPSLTENQFVEKTNTLVSVLIKKACEFIRIYREGDNGTINEHERRIRLEPISTQIAKLYYELGNLPAFYTSLQEWFDDRFLMATYISEMALFYQAKFYCRWDDNRRDYLVKKAITHFQEAFDSLQ